MNQRLIPRSREAGSRNWLRVLLAALFFAGASCATPAAHAAETISTIAGTVYLDTDGNGAIDAGDTLAGGVTVTLTDAAGAAVLDSTGAPIAAVVTNSRGRYAFFNVRTDQTYRVVETPSAGYAPNLAIGPAANVVKESNSVLVVSTPTPTGVATTFDGNNFLLIPPVQIAGYVYIDIAGTGLVSPADTLLSNPQVILQGDFNGDGVQDTAQAVVDATGHYTFTTWTNPANGMTQLIPPGNYTIVETVANGYNSVNAFPGSAGDVKTSVTSILVAAAVPGATYDNEDFLIGNALTGTGGNQPGNFSLSGFVWYDLNGDGLRAAVNPVDPGIERATVRLSGTDTGGHPVTATATTAADGSYTFQGLNPGTYTVTVDKTTLPVGINTETFDGIGSAPDGALDNQVTGTLTAANSPVSNVNFGYTGTASLGNTVWNDVNGNGVIDAGEKGIQGVSVNLVWAGPDGVFGTADDVVYPTQVTDVNGKYNFTDLPAGNFKVLVDSTSPSLGTFIQTYDLDGLSTPNSAIVSNLSVGQIRTDVNFGYWQAASVAGILYFDKNNNSLPDLGEGLSALKVSLETPAGVLVATSTTNAVGAYSFGTVTPGKYIVVAALVGGGGTVVSTNPLAISLAAGQNSVNNNFRYLATGTLSGTLTCSDDKSPLVGITVTLKDSSGNTLATVCTTSTGAYAFKNLPAGTYTLAVPLTANSLAINGSTSVTLALPAGGALVQNFTYKGGTICGYVFCDANGDGKKGSGEAGISGVTVTLRDCNGSTKTAATDSSGYYCFTGCLKSGAYTVSINSSCNGRKLTTASCRTVVLCAGQTVSNIDFGIDCNTACVSGTVYYDANGNGRIDCGDSYLQGVTVKLVDSSTHCVAATACTDCNGKYTFKNLPCGAYTVQVPCTLWNCLSAYASSQSITLCSGQCLTKDCRYYWNSGCGDGGDDDGGCGGDGGHGH